MHVFPSLDALTAAVGRPLGTGDWITVDQTMIDGFARVTGDHQWIHVDPARAAVESPFGATVAHGFLTLSLFPQMHYQLWAVEGVRGSLNYGLGKVRFPNAVRAGARVRGHLVLKSVEPQQGRALVTIEGTMEIEGETKPACVAEMLVMLLV